MGMQGRVVLSAHLVLEPCSSCLTASRRKRMVEFVRCARMYDNGSQSAILQGLHRVLCLTPRVVVAIHRSAASCSVELNSTSTPQEPLSFGSDVSAFGDRCFCLCSCMILCYLVDPINGRISVLPSSRGGVVPLSEILRVKTVLLYLMNVFCRHVFFYILQSQTKAARVPRALQPRERDCTKSSAVPRKEPPDSFVSMRLSSAARPKKPRTGATSHRAGTARSGRRLATRLRGSSGRGGLSSTRGRKTSASPTAPRRSIPRSEPKRTERGQPSTEHNQNPEPSSQLTF